MLNWMKELDRLLRGEATRLSALRRGTIEISPDGLSMVILVLGLLYGACMGCYALFRSGDPTERFLQLVAATGKVPVLFLLTLVVTFPSLYVFNALVGSRLTLSAVLRLIIAALAIMLAVLASFGPIVAFFSASTTSYPFMLLLNVVVFTVSGFLGLKFLLHTLHRLSVAQAPLPAPKTANSNGAPRHGTHQLVAPRPTSDEELFAAAASGSLAPIPPPPPVRGTTAPGGATAVAVAPPTPAQRVPGAAPAAPAPAASSEPGGALDRLEDHMVSSDVTTIFRIWIIVFGLVGAQMSWVLRPFIGAPDQPFTLFRMRESNFFEAVFHALSKLF